MAGLNLTIISNKDDRCCMVSVPATTTIGGLKSRIQKELGISAKHQVLMLRNEVISTNNMKTLSALGVKDNDLLSLIPSETAPPVARAAAPTSTTSTPASGRGFDFASFGDRIRNVGVGNRNGTRHQVSTLSSDLGRRNDSMDWEMVKAEIEKSFKAADSESKLDEEARRLIEIRDRDPSAVDAISMMDAEFGRAVMSGSLAEIKEAIKEKHIRTTKERFEEGKRLRKAQLDPTSAEAQQIMMDAARKNYHDDQAELRKQLNPDSEARVDMLYIPMEIMNHETNEYKQIDAFVDTGCQKTIMSIELCKELGCEKMIDTRMATVAVGVGMQKMAGMIHMLPARIGKQDIFISCMIMEKSPPFMFGLDLMKSHGAIIDLSSLNMKLLDQTIPFLTHAELVSRNIIDETKTASSEAAVLSDATRSQHEPSREELARLEANEMRLAQVAIVISSTGCSREEAMQVLTSCDWDSELAIGLILSTKG